MIPENTDGIISRKRIVFMPDENTKFFEPRKKETVKILIINKKHENAPFNRVLPLAIFELRKPHKTLDK
jgi:hypothetical protein